MADATLAVAALSGAAILLTAVIVLLAYLLVRSERDRARLTNLVAARDPREFAMLQKHSEPPKPDVHERAEPEHVLIGLGG